MTASKIQYDQNRDLRGNVAKDAAEKAQQNWRIMGLLGHYRQFGLY